ncbi:hypothetical protein JCM5353_008977 [Sporobolomyces roseus]
MSVSRLSTTRRIPHLLLSGYNPLSPPLTSQSSLPSSTRQSPSNPSLTPLPLQTWLSQLGRQHDSPSQIHSISSSTGHSLITYRNEQGQDRVIAVGRNESGQLGIGFASQEGTRGLVENFKGESVESVRTAVQAGYLLVPFDDTYEERENEEKKSSNSLYSFGNSSRGRLSQPNLFPHPLETDHGEHFEPTSRILPTPTLVDLPEEAGKIIQLESGFEHFLILTESGQLYGSGCNTDSQLSLPTSSSHPDVYSLTRIPVPPSIEEEQGGIKKILAGADTSGFITNSGKLFTWGNSEYAQAGHGKKIDMIQSPLEVSLENGRKIVDYRCGGSFGVILDDRNNIYTTGFGSLGLPSSPSPPTSSLHPTLIPSISSSFSSPITRIRAAHGYAIAISDSASSCSKMFSWGLNNSQGRLGTGSSYSGGGGERPEVRVEGNVKEPRELVLPTKELGLEEEGSEWGIGEVELGDEGMWVVLEEMRREEGERDGEERGYIE